MFHSEARASLSAVVLWASRESEQQHPQVESGNEERPRASSRVRWTIRALLNVFIVKKEQRSSLCNNRTQPPVLLTDCAEPSKATEHHERITWSSRPGTDTWPMALEAPLRGETKSRECSSTPERSRCRDVKDESLVWGVNLQGLGIQSASGRPFCSQPWRIQAPPEPLITGEELDPVQMETFCLPPDVMWTSAHIFGWYIGFLSSLRASMVIFSRELDSFFKMFQKKCEMFLKQHYLPKIIEFGEIWSWILASVPISSPISHAMIIGREKANRTRRRTQPWLSGWQPDCCVSLASYTRMRFYRSKCFPEVVVANRRTGVSSN